MEYIYVKAHIIRKSESVITIRLEDGFANAEVIVHRDSVLHRKDAIE